MRPSFDSRVSRISIKLTDVEDEIIGWLRKNCTETTTLREISGELFIASNTVFRLAKKLGYGGFSEMRYAVVSERDRRISREWISSGDEEIMDHIGRTMELIDPDIINDIVTRMTQSRRVRVRGFGQNSYYCGLLVRYLQYGGIENAAVGEEYSLKDMDDRDMEIFISNSGETVMLLQLAKEARNRKVFTVSLTNAHQNTLQKLVDTNLFFYSGYDVYQDLPDYIGLEIRLRMIANALWKMKDRNMDAVV